MHQCEKRADSLPEPHFRSPLLSSRSEPLQEWIHALYQNASSYDEIKEKTQKLMTAIRKTWEGVDKWVEQQNYGFKNVWPQEWGQVTKDVRKRNAQSHVTSFFREIPQDKWEMLQGVVLDFVKESSNEGSSSTALALPVDHHRHQGTLVTLLGSRSRRLPKEILPSDDLSDPSVDAFHRRLLDLNAQDRAIDAEIEQGQLVIEKSGRSRHAKDKDRQERRLKIENERNDIIEGLRRLRGEPEDIQTKLIIVQDTHEESGDEEEEEDLTEDEKSDSEDYDQDMIDTSPSLHVTYTPMYILVGVAELLRPRSSLVYKDLIRVLSSYGMLYENNSVLMLGYNTSGGAGGDDDRGYESGEGEGHDLTESGEGHDSIPTDYDDFVVLRNITLAFETIESGDESDEAIQWLITMQATLNNIINRNENTKQAIELYDSNDAFRDQFQNIGADLHDGFYTILNDKSDLMTAKVLEELIWEYMP